MESLINACRVASDTICIEMILNRHMSRDNDHMFKDQLEAAIHFKSSRLTVMLFEEMSTTMYSLIYDSTYASDIRRNMVMQTLFPLLKGKFYLSSLLFPKSQ
jgi:hypothetical protein